MSHQVYLVDNSGLDIDSIQLEVHNFTFTISMLKIGIRILHDLLNRE